MCVLLRPTTLILLLACVAVALTVTADKEDIKQAEVSNDKKLDKKDHKLVIKKKSGRFLNDLLLQPLRKVWKLYVMRTVLPSVMGIKLMVLVPTLAMVMTFLEGAIAAAAFFYVLFSTAVAGRNTEPPSLDPPFPWSILDSLINSSNDPAAGMMTTSGGDPMLPMVSMNEMMPIEMMEPIVHMDQMAPMNPMEQAVMQMTPTPTQDSWTPRTPSTDSYANAAMWGQSENGPYLLGSKNNNLDSYVNQSWNQAAASSSNNPFVTYYATYGNDKTHSQSKNGILNNGYNTLQ